MTPRARELREFVRKQNILAFATQLRTENDPTRRKLLLTLLSEHEVAEPWPVPSPLSS